MILTFNLNDFLFRPHRSDEFDKNRGGGIAFNQVAHQSRLCGCSEAGYAVSAPV